MKPAAVTQGTVIEDRTIPELPLPGRNPVEFALPNAAVMNETDMRKRRAALYERGLAMRRARVAFNPPQEANFP